MSPADGGARPRGATGRLTRVAAVAGVVAVALIAVVALVVSLTACGGPWVDSIGRPGTGDGEFRQPRGIAVSEHGLAVLDRTGRMQIFSSQDGPLARNRADLRASRGSDGEATQDGPVASNRADLRWTRTIEVVGGDVRRGLPTGAAWLPDGSIVVAHTHVSRLVFFSPNGVVTRSFGEYGLRPGQFLYPQRISLDDRGNFVVSEYGISVGNRVQVLTPDGAPLRCVGGPGEADGTLGRPMGAVAFADERIVVCDAKQGLVLFDAEGRPAGRFGPAPGDHGFFQGICRGGDGDIYVVDCGRHELLRIAADGTTLGILGAPDGSGLPGDAPEGFREPWDVAWHAGRVYVADMGNHRIARIDPERAPWRRP